VVALGVTWALVLAAMRGLLQYRANFLTMVVFGLIYQLTGFLFIWVILARFRAIGDWTLGEVAFLYGLRLVVHGLHMVAFGGLGRIRWLVRQGDFDRYMVRPLAPFLQTVTINLPPNGFGDLLGGVVLFAAANVLAGVDYSPLSLAYVALAIVGGVLIEGALQLLVAALAFRMVDNGNLSQLVFGLFDSFGNYPLKLFGGTVQFLLTFGVPVAFVAYFPAAVVLGRTAELSVHPALAYGAPLVGVAWFAVAYLVWRRELASYQSVGN
jgi:ABC-2 type transport system permease protein